MIHEILFVVLYYCNLLHVLGVGLVRGGCKRWPCGFVDRPGTGRIGGWVLVDCPEGCWSPTLGLSPYCVPREVICQWMTAEEVLILAINNLRAIRRQLAFWTCGPLTGFWCCHSTGKKKLSASLFFVRQRHTAPHFVIATGAERGTSNSPGVSGVYPILFFRCVFFWGIRCKQWNISYSSSISGYFGAGVPHMLVLFCAITHLAICLARHSTGTHGAGSQSSSVLICKG